MTGPRDLPVSGTWSRDLIAARLSVLGFGQRRSRQLINSILAIMSDELAAGRPVRVRGFGTFESVTRAPRVGRELKSGKPVAIEARRTIAFRPSKTLRDRLTRKLQESARE